MGLEEFCVGSFCAHLGNSRGFGGAKGLGEPALAPTAAAIANAIYAAVGVRVKAFPITPEKILEGLRRKEGK